MTGDNLLKNKLLTPNLYGVIAFTLLYVIAAAVGAFVYGNREFIFYIVILVVMAALICLIHSRVRLSAGALWCLSTWGFLHMAGGLVKVPASWPINGESRVLYSLWLIPEYLKYDHLIHAFGFGVTTWVCWQGIRAAVKEWADLRPTFGLLVLCVAGGMGFGALNEIIEFAATLTIPDTNVGGYINTGWDLTANLVGSVTAAVMIRFSCCKAER